MTQLSKSITFPKKQAGQVICYSHHCIEQNVMHASNTWGLCHTKSSNLADRQTDGHTNRETDRDTDIIRIIHPHIK